MLNKIKTDYKRARSNDLAIRVDIGNEIGMNKTVIEALNHPKNLNFWWSKNERVLAISAADNPTDRSIPIPDFFYKTRNGSKIRNWKLIRAVKTLANWEDNSVHLLTGEFVPELHMVVFRLGDMTNEN